MQTNTLSEKNRAILLEVFKQYRANDDESDGDYSHRDRLEKKLTSGDGLLDEVDIQVLSVAVAYHIPDEDTFRSLTGLLGL